MSGISSSESSGAQRPPPRAAGSKSARQPRARPPRRTGSREPAPPPHRRTPPCRARSPRRRRGPSRFARASPAPGTPRSWPAGPGRARSWPPSCRSDAPRRVTPARDSTRAVRFRSCPTFATPRPPAAPAAAMRRVADGRQVLDLAFVLALEREREGCSVPERQVPCGPGVHRQRQAHQVAPQRIRLGGLRGHRHPPGLSGSSHDLLRRPPGRSTTSNAGPPGASPGCPASSGSACRAPPPVPSPAGHAALGELRELLHQAPELQVHEDLAQALGVRLARP